MMKWLLSIICAAMLISAPQRGFAFKDGEELLEFSESQDVCVVATFVMYIKGVGDAIRAVAEANDRLGVFCPSNDITNEDLGDAVRIWLRSNPNSRKASAVSQVVFALGHHFPCK